MTGQRTADNRPGGPVNRRDGRDASNWLLAGGWEVGELHRPLTVFGDDHVVGNAFLRRVWHTPRHLSRRHSEWDGHLYVVLQVSGTLLLELRGGKRAFLSEGSFYVGPRDSIDGIRARNPSARIEVQLPVEYALVTDVGAPAFVVRHKMNQSMQWIALCSVVNSVLNSTSRACADSSEPLMQGVVELVRALTIECAGVHVRNTAQDEVREPLYIRAHGLLGRRARTEGYSVADLAAELGVTPRHLSRVFREHGTTPARALRLLRLDMARRLEDASPSLPSSEVARLSGFPSSRAMRRALRMYRQQASSPDRTAGVPGPAASAEFDTRLTIRG